LIREVELIQVLLDSQYRKIESPKFPYQNSIFVKILFLHLSQIGQLKAVESLFFVVGKLHALKGSWAHNLPFHPILIEEKFSIEPELMGNLGFYKR
jgi:hypothetical protein